MTQVGNWVSEYCTTEGDGPLSLVGARTNRVRFNQAMPSGDTWYLVEDMETRTNEVGIGAFDGRATIVRHTPLCIFDGEGRYERSPSSPLELSGNSVVSSTMAAEMYEFLVSRVNNLEVVMPDKLEWAGNWVETVYKKNVIVNDNGWLMVSNKTTSDRAAPIISNDRAELLPYFDSRESNTALEKVEFGYNIKFSTDGFITDFSYFLATRMEHYNYSFTLIDLSAPGNPIITNTNFSVDNYDDWNLLDINSPILTANNQYRVLITIEEGPGDQIFLLDYIFEGVNNNTGPEVGYWNRSSNHSEVRIHKFSANQESFEYLLSRLEAGSVITFRDANDPLYFVTYTVNSITDEGEYFEYAVSLTDSLGSLPDDGPTKGTAEPALDIEVQFWQTPISPFPPLEYIAEYSGYAEVDDNSLPDATNRFFGLGISFNPAEVSPDWDIMASSSNSGGGSGGGGGAPFSSEITETTATDGQISFTTPEYVMGNGSLAVFINGVRQPPSAYTEVNTTTIQFSEGLIVGDLVMLEVRK